MATAREFVDCPPAGMAGLPDGELAEVIQLNPSPDQRGFSYQDLVRPDRVIHGLGRLAAQTRDFAWDRLLHDDDGLERESLTYNGHEHLVLTSGPSLAKNVIWLKPGLTELADVGAPVWLHKAVAKRNPDSLVMTHATKGMSHGGQTVPAGEAGARWIDMHAAEDLVILGKFAGNLPVDVLGTSWGSFNGSHMIIQNLRAKDGRQVDIRKFKPLAPAIVACEVDPEEDFREPDLDEAAFRAAASSDFNKHVLFQTMGLVKHPRQLRAAWKVAADYAMHPEKLDSRLKIIKADYRSVQQGFPWRSLLLLANELEETHFVFGEKDPLTAIQIPQVHALQERSPRDNVRYTVIKGAGHFATADANKVADTLYGQPAALAQAA